MNRGRTNAITLPRAFTLVELLVVIGIIALLLSILLPALSRVKEASNRAKCLANIAELGRAVLLYAHDNKDHLPDAGSGNAPDALMSPRAVGLPPWTTFGPNNTYVLPSIGQLLEKYLNSNTRFWICPSAPSTSFILTGANPLAGTGISDQFKPNYVYLSAKEYIPALPGLGTIATKFHVPEWAVRNVSGLKTTKVVSRSGNTASEIVLFYDRSPSYHQYHKTDIYSGQSGDYFASYCYLDGHADGRGYGNWADYMRVFHNPIPQAWFGQDFPSLFPAEYGEYTAGASYQH
jgi:prepilin-type N-terminal cleavage/methylation domain-containing protein